MAWIHQNKPGERFRLFDRKEGKTRVIIKNLGIYKGLANSTLVNYEKAVSMGFVFTPPITVADLEGFLKAKAAGQDYSTGVQRITIAEMCDLYLLHFGPSLKGGISKHYASTYNKLRLRLEQFKRMPVETLENGRTPRKWGELYADEVNLYHVRDLLAQWKTIGTQMRNMGALGAMFRALEKWNRIGNVLPWKVQLPGYNPFSAWRAEMKPSQKKEYADKRVLTHQEWDDFKIHLTIRARQICEIALQRFLRLSDIRALTEKSQTEDAFEKKGYLKGYQQKTGEPFLVPLIPGHPVKYDFTNFRRDFLNAQSKALMNMPPGHPLHFSVKDLRRTGATWAYKETRDIVTISKMLGHQKLSTTQRYLNVDETDLYAVAKVVDAIASGKMQP